jgi:NADH-quinone oxidoreductase subunit M
MILLAILLLPLATGLALGWVPRQYLRLTTLGGGALTLLLSLTTMAAAANGTPLDLQADWVAGAGLTFHLNADGVSSSLLALNALVGLLALAAARPEPHRRPRIYLALLLLAESAVAGVLTARDLVLFFVFWEAVLIPIFILVGVYGEGRRQYSALKLVIFTSAGSLAMLLAILTLYAAQGGGGTFAFDQLAHVRLAGGAVAGVATADLAFIGFALAFAIKTPIFPLHGWLADAYTSAPTPVVMMLAGVVSKLGPYGFYRVGIGLLPGGMQRFSPLLMTLAAAGIIYGALLALRQDDVKRMVAYISLSHMCFITLGIVGLVPAGVSGALLQMLNHGILITALFFISGHVEGNLGTRLRSRLRGLGAGAPAFASIFLVLSLATLGLPGLNGFVGEYLIMLGTFTRSWALLIATAVGVVLASWYTLRLYQGLMDGEPAGEETVGEGTVEVASLEMGVLVPLASLAVVIGVYPAPLLDLLGRSAAVLTAGLGGIGG